MQISNLTKWIARIAALAAAIGAIVFVLMKIKEHLDARKDELDAYLLGSSETGTKTFTVSSNDPQTMRADMKEWGNLGEGSKITMSFLVKPEFAKDFQAAMAKEGCSSTYDEPFEILDVYVAPMKQDELMKLADVIDKQLEESKGIYEGFAMM